jgi:hypothetical protein
MNFYHRGIDGVGGRAVTASAADGRRVFMVLGAGGAALKERARLRTTRASYFGTPEKRTLLSMVTRLLLIIPSLEDHAHAPKH